MQRNTSEALRNIHVAQRDLEPVTFADTHGGRKNTCLLAPTCPMSDEPDCGGCCPAAEEGQLVWAPYQIDRDAYTTNDHYFVDEEGCYDDDAFTWEAEDRLGAHIDDSDRDTFDSDANSHKETTMAHAYKPVLSGPAVDDAEETKKPNVAITIIFDFETVKKLTYASMCAHKVTTSEFVRDLLLDAADGVEYKDPLGLLDALTEFEVLNEQLNNSFRAVDDDVQGLLDEASDLFDDEFFEEALKDLEDDDPDDEGTCHDIVYGPILRE